MQRYQSTLAIVINKKQYKEKDIITTLLTPRLGKITVLAKGAQSINSTRLGSLQLGNIIKIQIYTKNDFTWLSESQTLESFLVKDKKLVQLNLLFYFLELINRLIADNQQIDGVYSISEKIIKAINRSDLVGYLKYEIELIKILGFGLPNEIENNFLKGDYKMTQTYIKRFFESIVEKPLESNKLFK
ncbi:MAG TPA: DNA repair protein RecO [Patescibacteria group bacterium]